MDLFPKKKRAMEAALDFSSGILSIRSLFTKFCFPKFNLHIMFIIIIILLFILPNTQGFLSVVLATIRIYVSFKNKECLQ